MLIMTIATKPFASVLGVVTRIAARGFAGVTSLTKAIIHRREVLRLTELDERGLKDIGLVRSDVEGALATSWLDDPSTILAARSGARSGVASARRAEGARQAQVKAPAMKVGPVTRQSVTKQAVACSA
ncbi:DUF1127 domain-containing protein [Bosea vaviloviae]|uniref:YjiS-like domain-containing protein n=1 Tax=Bosea vaviloviae TaxID=1526658 RepID=A0A1D7U0K5_9HYPH|nr:DUF1127 domain-containing protein [Bosea vaviloviae]AOO80901.1 hypothetical protein BHK69_10900 [Bosea vaviloviae]